MWFVNFKHSKLSHAQGDARLFSYAFQILTRFPFQAKTGFNYMAFYQHKTSILAFPEGSDLDRFRCVKIASFLVLFGRFCVPFWVLFCSFSACVSLGNSQRIPKEFARNTQGQREEYVWNTYRIQRNYAKNT